VEVVKLEVVELVVVEVVVEVEVGALLVVLGRVESSSLDENA